ncbi:MAG: glycosyltransferase family 4 protein [Roseburia sp.]|nr:glycosyltransferase family 4 protein [Roseburia sp.]
MWRKFSVQQNQIKKRALMLASVASMLDFFNADNINILLELGYSVDVVANFEFGSATSKERVAEYRKELKEKGIGIYHVPIPRDLSMIKALYISYRKIKCLMNDNHYSIVHCHSPIGGALCRIGGRSTRKKGTRIIYTAHGFHFYKGAPIKNWLLFYPVEKCLSRYTDVLVTINREDYSRARKKFHAQQTVYVPGVGVDTEKFQCRPDDRDKKREELEIESDDIMLLSVGELNVNKNHSVVIKALTKIKKTQPQIFEKIHYFIAGKGTLGEILTETIKKEDVFGHVHLLGYREDVNLLYCAADAYILPSMREGLNVSLMEAMASGLPCICGNIRGNKDLIKEDLGGYLFSPSDEDELAEKLMKLLNNGQSKKMGLRNRRTIKDYSRKKVMNNMRIIYEEM